MAAKKPLQEGDPAQDARGFRSCLGQFATGVAVVTAQDGDRLAGVTVNSFASVSLDPPLILWSLGKASRSHDVFHASEAFAVNLLSARQIELSRKFSGSDDNKFHGIAWTEGSSGAPLLDGVVAQFECRREAIYPGGDHDVVLGRVSRFAKFEGNPLLFVQGRYGIAADHPDAIPASGLMTVATERPQLSLIESLFKAQRVMSAEFEAHRRAEGISFAVGRVLAGAYERPGIHPDALARETFLGERDVEDAIADLAKRSLLIRRADGGIELTADGNERRRAVRARWERFQQERINGLSQKDVESSFRVLAALTERGEPSP